MNQQNAVGRISIQPNNAIFNCTCAVCGGLHECQLPYTLMVETENNEWGDICDFCAEKYAPELLKMIRTFYQNSGDEAFFDRCRTEHFNA